MLVRLGLFYYRVDMDAAADYAGAAAEFRRSAAASQKDGEALLGQALAHVARAEDGRAARLLDAITRPDGRREASHG